MERLARRSQFRSRTLHLADWNAGATPCCRHPKEAAERLARNLERIDVEQYRLYAGGTRSLLVVLQGMDTAGKDGLIRNVLTVFNPQGCRVWPFKVPTSEEASHDFLWRIQRAVPARGQIAVFNRSHYEDVLAVRVHELVPRSEWSRRFAIINAFEKRLRDQGTLVLKFFLHVSRKEQLARLLARLDDPLKRWKFSSGDISERTRWKDYQRAYETALVRCNTRHAPWHIVSADHKWYRDLVVSEVIAGALESMRLRVPVATLDVKRLRAKLRAT